MITNPNAFKWLFNLLVNGLRFIAEVIFCLLVIVAFCYPATLGYHAVACEPSAEPWGWAVLALLVFPIAFPVFGCLLVALTVVLAISIKPFNQFKGKVKYLSYIFLTALLLGLVSYGFSYALDATTKCNFGF